MSCGIFILWGTYLERTSPGGMVDFKAVYYGARTLLQHRDPYKEAEFLRVYVAEGGQIPSDPVIAQMFLRAVPVCINLPTALFIVAPFSILSWGPAYLLWMLLTAGCLCLAAFLILDLAGNHSPGVSIFLICMVVANCEIVYAGGNIAGVAISVCIVSVWCFLKERYVFAGIICLAISLILKPHDIGLVWLFFLLAGGVYRKRALQTSVVAIALGIASILWVSNVAPNWMQELHANISEGSVSGGLNDPGPASLSFRSADSVIDLQSAISIFQDDPHVYNPASYLVCGALLLVWSVRTLRVRFSPQNVWYALAAIAAFSMLPVYHRQHDAKLLLLTVPACAMLWAEGGLIRWPALILNTAGVVLTADIPLAILAIRTNNLHLDTTGIFCEILTVVQMRPAPLILLAIGILYLYVYVRRTVPATDKAQRETIVWVAEKELQPAEFSSSAVPE
ncbi:MAG: glycosyltransferase family 87 protein [Terracidiphilus sp.]|nr:glycosyltransferase family 87 protein [Terracidiphilus sp.]